MRIGVIGNGVVGSATARTWLEWVDEVRVHDANPRRSTHSLAEALDCDLTFLCLPTPALDDGRCDISAITDLLTDLSIARGKCRLVLRSTVPIGTTARLAHEFEVDICHYPEFLTARCAFTDAHTPARNIIGVHSIAARPRSKAALTLQDLVRERFPGVALTVMRSDESEAVKLMLNSFFAIKVAAFNEFQEVCRAHGIDWERVREGMLGDGRIAHAHTRVPGPDGRYGFGGACLPKDLANLACAGMGKDLPMWVCRAAQNRNKKDRERKE